MASGTFYPVVDGDDGMVLSTVFLTGSDYNFIGSYYSLVCHDFFRFVNVTIPQGSTIDLCVLKVYSYNNYSDAIAALIHFADADNQDAPTDYTEFAALTLTDGIGWNITDPWTANAQYESPELKAGLQTVVDRDNFASGSAVLVALKDNSSSNSRAISDIRYSGGIYKVELYAEWTEPEPEPTDYTRYFKIKKTADPYDEWDPEFTVEKEIIRTGCGEPYEFDIMPDYDLAPCDDPSYYFRLNPMGTPILSSDSVDISVAGGVSPYTWTIDNDYLFLKYAETIGIDNRVYSLDDGTNPTDAIVTVTDACGNERTGIIRWCGSEDGPEGNSPLPGPPFPSEVSGWMFYLERLDGVLVDDTMDAEFTVYDSNGLEAGITDPVYDSETQCWTFEIGGVPDPKGHWVEYTCTGGIPTQYPLKYKTADKQNTDDLILLSGTVTETTVFLGYIHYWIVSDYIWTPAEFVEEGAFGTKVTIYLDTWYNARRQCTRSLKTSVEYQVTELLRVHDMMDPLGVFHMIWSYYYNADYWDDYGAYAQPSDLDGGYESTYVIRSGDGTEYEITEYDEYENQTTETVYGSGDRNHVVELWAYMPLHLYLAEERFTYVNSVVWVYDNIKRLVNINFSYDWE